jgi:hypothetical protein
VRAGPGVLVPDFGQLFSLKPRSKLHERWPQPPVYVRHLAVDQLANQYFRALTDGLGHTEYLMTLRMAPPAPSDRAARDGLRKARDRPSRGLKHDSVKLDERQSLFRAHTTPRRADLKLSACGALSGGLNIEHFALGGRLGYMVAGSPEAFNMELDRVSNQSHDFYA